MFYKAKYYWYGVSGLIYAGLLKPPAALLVLSWNPPVAYISLLDNMQPVQPL